MICQKQWGSRLVCSAAEGLTACNGSQKSLVRYVDSVIPMFELTPSSGDFRVWKKNTLISFIITNTTCINCMRSTLSADRLCRGGGVYRETKIILKKRGIYIFFPSRRESSQTLSSKPNYSYEFSLYGYVYACKWKFWCFTAKLLPSLCICKDGLKFKNATKEPWKTGENCHLKIDTTVALRDKVWDSHNAKFVLTLTNYSYTFLYLSLCLPGKFWLCATLGGKEKESNFVKIIWRIYMPLARVRFGESMRCRKSLVTNLLK